MSKQPDTKTGGAGNISIGGGVQGSAVAAGHGNWQQVTTSVVPTKPDDDVLAALNEIRTALGSLSGPRAGTATREIEAAIAAARAEVPDKEAVGGALESAIEAAKKAEEFAGIAANLAPYVQTAVAWLGGQWTHLVAMLG